MDFSDESLAKRIKELEDECDLLGKKVEDDIVVEKSKLCPTHPPQLDTFQ